MALRLSIVSRHGPTLGTRGVKEFGPEGGTIGRSLDCNWPLPDTKRYLSSRHASIDFRSGSYYIVDTSTNGVYVNEAEQPVGRGKPQRLFGGDRIRIGEYIMSVEIDEDPIAPLIDENHVDPVDIAQRVEAPDPTGNDLVDAYEITGVGIEMMLTDDELETLTPPARSTGGAYFEIVDDDRDSHRTPAARGTGAGAVESPDTVRVLSAGNKAKAKAPRGTAPSTAIGSAPPAAATAVSTAPPAAVSRAPAAAVSPTPAAAASPAVHAPASRSAQLAASAPASPSGQTATALAASIAATPEMQQAPETRVGAVGPKARRAKPATSQEHAAPARTSAATPATTAKTPMTTQRARAPKPATAAKAAVPAARVNAASAKGAYAPTATRADARTATHASGAQNLDPFFQGAGLSIRLPPQQIDAFLFRLGQVVNAMIVGITENLHVRAEQKNALRLESTTIQPQDNNPLKLSAGVEEAFVNLLLRDSDAHLPAVEAVREAFDDVKLHQQLVLKSVRAALEAFVARLDPEELEQKFARGRTNVLVNAANRLKYWDFYKDLYDVVAHHPPGELPVQFLEDFAQAYERELEHALGAGTPATEHRQAG